MLFTCLIVSSVSLAVSTTTLVVILVGAKRAQTLVTEATQTADSKLQGLKQAVANL